MAKTEVEAAFEQYLANGLPDIDPREKIKGRILSNLHKAIKQARTPILVNFQDDADMMAVLTQSEQLEALVTRAIDNHLKAAAIAASFLAKELSDTQSNHPLDDKT
jgi:hypothetical protein